MSDRRNYPYDDYADGDFFEETPPAEQPQDDRMGRLLAQLSDLKESLTRVSAPGADSPSAAPAPAASAQTGRSTADLMSEIDRLREENRRAREAQEMDARMARMRADLERDLALRAQGTADPQLLAEVRRLSARLSELEREDAPAAPAAPAAKRTPTSAGPAARETEDLASKLDRIDNLLGEISVMTIANDVTPLAHDLAELKDMIAASKATASAADGERAADYEDKLLDGVVAIQSLLEDVKATLDEHVSASAGTGEVVQDNLFETSSVEKIAELSRQIGEEFARLDEEIADMHADLRIYGDGFDAEHDGAPAAHIAEADRIELGAKLDAAEKSLNELGEALGKLARKEDMERMAASLDRLADALGQTLAARKDDGLSAAVDTLALIAARLEAMQADLDALKAAPAAEALTARFGAIENGLAQVRKADASGVIANLTAAIADLGKKIPDAAAIRAIVREELAAPAAKPAPVASPAPVAKPAPAPAAKPAPAPAPAVKPAPAPAAKPAPAPVAKPTPAPAAKPAKK